MEVVGYDRKKVLWWVLEDHVIVEVNYHEDIGLQGFGLNLFEEDGKEVSR